MRVRHRLRSGVAAAGVVALVTGCTVGPDFTSPASPEQKDYETGGTPQAGDQHFAVGRKIAGDWWTLYHSEPLTAVLEQAVAGNRTLAAARATLSQAQEAVLQAQAGLLPQIDLSAAGERMQQSPASFGLAKLPSGFPGYFNVYRVGPTVSYALDPFGLTRRGIEESQALAEVGQYQLDAAYLSLTGNAVTEALTIASLRAQIATAEGIIADDVENLRLVQREMDAGAATQLDVETAQSQLAADRTSLPPLRQQLSVARHALAILVGKAPSDWSPPDFDLAALQLPTELPVSLPSMLVRQRPDVLAAEARLHAASAAVGVATAQLYPNISLTASLSQVALSPDLLFHGASDIWSFGVNAAAPIFHGGALEAQRRAAEDAFNSELATYEQTVLQSFGQVADVLAALGHDAELLDEQKQALDSAETALRLTRTSYQAGNVGILQVLDAQRLSERARIGYVQAQAQRYLDTAQLFVAMGGGWWEWHDHDGGAAPAAAPAPAQAPAR